MNLLFTTLDVFTKTPLKGNPLAVVTLPPPSQTPPLTQTQKQSIAREFNLSETVFVHDVDDPATTTSRQIDIFTPNTELPFAGHPTIGSAVFLRQQGVQTLITKAGPISCEFAPDGSARASIPHNVRLHRKRLPRPGYSPSDDGKLAPVAEAEEGARLFSIVKGMTFALIELPSVEILGAAKIGATDLIPSELLDAEWRHDFESRRYYFVRLETETSPDGKVSTQKVRTRLVKRAMEDAATGSAACALACYLALQASCSVVRVEITQGVEMARESLIVVDVEVEESEGHRQVQAVYLGGGAVEVMSGVIKNY